MDERSVIIRSLKKRGKLKGRHFRPVPVPQNFLQRFNHTHDIRVSQANSDHKKLWSFGRTKGWRLIKAVMDHAGITGVKSCARGLRHTLGVHGAVNEIPEARLRKWMGHASLETTGIYMEAIGAEDRAIAERMW